MYNSIIKQVVYSDCDRNRVHSKTESWLTLAGQMAHLGVDYSITMTDYQEIIRLNSLELSNVFIAGSLGCLRNTVSEVLKLAETHSLG